MEIDNVSTEEMLRIINSEDKKVAIAVEKEIPNIARAVDAIVDRLFSGGRLIYIGAGTSGRLGILDASECPPTFGTEPELIQALIAGGESAIQKAVEGAEDNGELGVSDLKGIGFNRRDVIVGIAASGRTPYVLEAVKYAKSIGALAIGVNCNPYSELTQISDIAISPVVGAEVISGSTRMKAGTAQKMILNMLSTGAMIKYGKVYGNLMVDVKASNYKLVERCKSIVMEAAGVSLKEAEDMLDRTNYNCKLSIFSLVSGLEPEVAERVLDKNKGYIRKALDSIGV